jgi:hypothetical protein
MIFASNGIFRKNAARRLREADAFDAGQDEGDA